MRSVTRTVAPAGLRRRQLLLALGGAAATAGLVACGGGGGGGEADPGTPAEATLKMQTHPTQGTTARAVFGNGAGGTITTWVDPAGGALTQSLYQHDGREVRTFYGAGGEILRIVDESDGSFVTSTVVSADRTDYNAYDAAGAWQGGFAVIRNADGSYSSAQILTSAGLQGSQINGNLSGAVVASFSLLPSGNSGLGPLTPLGTTATTFAALRATASPTLAWLDRLTDRMFPMAHAQAVPGSSGSNFIKAAWFAAAGALVYTSTLPLAPLIGTALMGYGAYKLYQGLTGIIDANTPILDQVSAKILGNSMDAFVEDRAPLDDLRDKLNDYMDRGSTALANLTSIESWRQKAETAASTVASTASSVATSAWQAVTSSPPPGDTELSGMMVDNTGQTYPVTGTYDGEDDSISFDSGPVAGTQISGTGTAPDGSQGSGTYTIDRNGATQTGTFTVDRKPLGACQTQQSSGGQGAFTNSYDLGKDAGTFELTYQMYSIPDQLEVKDSAGDVLFSTNGLVSGSQTVNIPYTGGRIIFVIISAPTSGTAWDYAIGCPT